MCTIVCQTHQRCVQRKESYARRPGSWLKNTDRRGLRRWRVGYTGKGALLPLGDDLLTWCPQIWWIFSCYDIVQLSRSTCVFHLMGWHHEQRASPLARPWVGCTASLVVGRHRSTEGTAAAQISWRLSFAIVIYHRRFLSGVRVTMAIVTISQRVFILLSGSTVVTTDNQT